MSTNFLILESLRKHNKSALIEKVKVYLSHLVDLPPEEMEKIMAYVEGEEPSPVTRYLRSTSSAASTDSCKLNNKFAPPKEKKLASNIFGNPLSSHSLRQAMRLVDFLNEDDNFLFEGIFRKSGAKERQQDLRFMLNNGARVDLKANRFTPVDVSCVLKEFIQKLPEPLLTVNHFELHYELSMATKNETQEREELETKNAKRLKIIQLLLHLIPELNRKFFMSLMELFNRVVHSYEITKQNESNLATIFGQYLLCPRKWTPKQVQKNIDTLSEAMEFLLKNHDKLFTGPIELVLAAEKKLKKIPSIHRKQGNPISSAGGGDTLTNKEDDENSPVLTFCQRKQPEDTTTEIELAKLYAQIQALPETPLKKKLVKRANQYTPRAF